MKVPSFKAIQSKPMGQCRYFRLFDTYTITLTAHYLLEIPIADEVSAEFVQ